MFESEKANERGEGRGEREAGKEVRTTGSPLGWASNPKASLSVHSGEQDL